MNLRGLLSQDTQRRIKLVESLYLSSTGLTITQVKQITNSSLLTIQQDIGYINQNYTPFQITLEDKLYKIIQQNEKGLDALYEKVIDSSMEFKLLEMLLYEEFYAISDLADSLFTSVSSVYRIITRIEKVLKPLKITIAKRPLRILGNEAVIRHLFGLFFREKKMPFKKLAKNDQIHAGVKSLINQFMTLNLFYEAYITQVRVEYNFYVSLIRTANGHFFDDRLIRSTAVKTPDIGSWQSTILQIEKAFAVQFDTRFYRECFWLFYGDFLILNPDQMTSALAENPRLASLYDLSESLLDYLEDTIDGVSFSECKSQEKDLRTTLKVFLNNETYLYQYAADFISIIGEYRKSFMNELAHLYAYQIKKLDQYLKAFYRRKKKYKLPISDDIIINQMYILIIHYPELMQKISNSQDQIHILIMSLVYPRQERFLQTVISENITGNIKYHFITQMSELDEDKNFLKDIDLIISTSSLSERFKDYPVFVIEPFPTVNSYLTLQGRVNEIIKKKHNITN